MKRLVVCGWDEQTAALLRAVSLRSDLRAVAIGDDRPAALVRARTATGLPCYQHLREMLRSVEFDVLLVGDTADGEALIELATEQGASIILRGDAADARTLGAAIDAVPLGAGGLNVTRPDLNRAGIDLLASLTSGDPDWAPDLLHIELSNPNGVESALNTAVALLARLQPETATQTAAAALRGHTDMVLSASVQIRHEDSAVTMLTVQGHQADRWRIAVQSPAGRAELLSENGESTLTLEPIDGGADRSELVDDDLIDLEAVRIANPASRRHDERFAPIEAAILTSIEASLNTGFVTPVRDPGARGNLRVLEGGQATTSRRQGHLRILGG